MPLILSLCISLLTARWTYSATNSTPEGSPRPATVTARQNPLFGNLDLRLVTTSVFRQQAALRAELTAFSDMKADRTVIASCPFISFDGFGVCNGTRLPAGVAGITVCSFQRVNEPDAPELVQSDFSLSSDQWQMATFSFMGARSPPLPPGCEPNNASCNALGPVVFDYNLIGRSGYYVSRIKVSATWHQVRTGALPGSDVAVPGSAHAFTVEFIDPNFVCNSRVVQNFTGTCTISTTSVPIYPSDFSIDFSGATITSVSANHLKFNFVFSKLASSPASNLVLNWNPSWRPGVSLSPAATRSIKVVALDQARSDFILALDPLATKMQGICSIAYLRDAAGQLPSYFNDFDISYSPATGVFGTPVAGPAAGADGSTYTVKVAGSYQPFSTVNFKWKTSLGVPPAEQGNPATAMTFTVFKVPPVLMSCYPDAVAISGTGSSDIACSIWAQNSALPVALEDLPGAIASPATAGVLQTIRQATCSANCSAAAAAAGAAPENGVYCSAPCSYGASVFFSFVYTANRAANVAATGGASLQLPFDFNFIRNIDGSRRDAASIFISFLKVNVTCPFSRLAVEGSAICVIKPVGTSGPIKSPSNFVITTSTPDLLISDFVVTDTVNASASQMTFRVTAASRSTYISGLSVDVSYAAALGGGTVPGSPLPFTVLVSEIQCSPDTLIGLFGETPQFTACSLSPAGDTPDIALSDLDGAFAGSQPGYFPYSSIAANGTGVSFRVTPFPAGVFPIRAPFRSLGGPAQNITVTGIKALNCTPERALPGDTVTCVASKGEGLPALSTSTFLPRATFGTIDTSSYATTADGDLTFNYVAALGRGSSDPGAQIYMLYAPGVTSLTGERKAVFTYVAVVSVDVSCSCSQSGLAGSECRIRTGHVYSCTVSGRAGSAVPILSDLAFGSWTLTNLSAIVNPADYFTLYPPLQTADGVVLSGKALNSPVDLLQCSLSVLGRPTTDGSVRITILRAMNLECMERLPAGIATPCFVWPTDGTPALRAQDIRVLVNSTLAPGISLGAVSVFNGTWPPARGSHRQGLTFTLTSIRPPNLKLKETAGAFPVNVFWSDATMGLGTLTTTAAADSPTGFAMAKNPQEIWSSPWRPAVVHVKQITCGDLGQGPTLITGRGTTGVPGSYVNCTLTMEPDLGMVSVTDFYVVGSAWPVGQDPLVQFEECSSPGVNLTVCIDQKQTSAILPWVTYPDERWWFGDYGLFGQYQAMERSVYRDDQLYVVAMIRAGGAMSSSFRWGGQGTMHQHQPILLDTANSQPTINVLEATAQCDRNRVYVGDAVNCWYEASERSVKLYSAFFSGPIYFSSLKYDPSNTDCVRHGAAFIGKGCVIAESGAKETGKNTYTSWGDIAPELAGTTTSIIGTTGVQRSKNFSITFGAPRRIETVTMRLQFVTQTCWTPQSETDTTGVRCTRYVDVSVSVIQVHSKVFECTPNPKGYGSGRPELRRIWLNAPYNHTCRMLEKTVADGLLKGTGDIEDRTVVSVADESVASLRSSDFNWTAVVKPASGSSVPPWLVLPQQDSQGSSAASVAQFVIIPSAVSRKGGYQFGFPISPAVSPANSRNPPEYTDYHIVDGEITQCPIPANAILYAGYYAYSMPATTNGCWVSTKGTEAVATNLDAVYVSEIIGENTPGRNPINMFLWNKDWTDAAYTSLAPKSVEIGLFADVGEYRESWMTIGFTAASWAMAKVLRNVTVKAVVDYRTTCEPRLRIRAGMTITCTLAPYKVDNQIRGPILPRAAITGPFKLTGFEGTLSATLSTPAPALPQFPEGRNCASEWCSCTGSTCYPYYTFTYTALATITKATNSFYFNLNFADPAALAQPLTSISTSANENVKADRGRDIAISIIAATTFDCKPRKVATCQESGTNRGCYFSCWISKTTASGKLAGEDLALTLSSGTGGFQPILEGESESGNQGSFAWKSSSSGTWDWDQFDTIKWSLESKQGGRFNIAAKYTIDDSLVPGASIAMTSVEAKVSERIVEDGNVRMPIDVLAADSNYHFYIAPSGDTNAADLALADFVVCLGTVSSDGTCTTNTGYAFIATGPGYTYVESTTALPAGYTYYPPGNPSAATRMLRFTVSTNLKTTPMPATVEHYLVVSYAKTLYYDTSLATDTYSPYTSTFSSLSTTRGKSSLGLMGAPVDCRPKDYDRVVYKKRVIVFKLGSMKCNDRTITTTGTTVNNYWSESSPQNTPMRYRSCVGCIIECRLMPPNPFTTSVGHGLVASDFTFTLTGLTELRKETAWFEDLVSAKEVQGVLAVFRVDASTASIMPKYSMVTNADTANALAAAVTVYTQSHSYSCISTSSTGGRCRVAKGGETRISITRNVLTPATPITAVGNDAYVTSPNVKGIFAQYKGTDMWAGTSDWCCDPNDAEYGGCAFCSGSSCASWYPKYGTPGYMCKFSIEQQRSVRATTTGDWAVNITGEVEGGAGIAKLYYYAGSDLTDRKWTNLGNNYHGAVAAEVPVDVLALDYESLSCNRLRVAANATISCRAVIAAGSPDVSASDFLFGTSVASQFALSGSISLNQTAPKSVVFTARAATRVIQKEAGVYLSWALALDKYQSQAVRPLNIAVIRANLSCDYIKANLRDLITCGLVGSTPNIGMELRTSDFGAPKAVSATGTVLTTTNLFADANGGVGFNVTGTLGVQGVITVSISYSDAIGGTLVGTVAVPSPILSMLNCSRTVLGLRETMRCDVTKETGSIDFTKDNFIVDYDGPVGTVNITNIANQPTSTSKNKFSFDVRALVLENLGAVTVANKEAPDFKDTWTTNITSGLTFACPLTRMGVGQTVNCAAAASVALLRTDIKAGRSSTGAFSFGPLVFQSSTFKLPMTALSGSLREAVSVVLPTDDGVVPFVIDVPAATSIACTPSAGPTRLLLGTNARCTLLKSPSSAPLLVTDFIFTVTGGASISTIEEDGSGSLNFTYDGSVLCGTSGCEVSVSYAPELGGTFVASNTFFIINATSVECPSGRKARGVSSPCVLTSAADGAALVADDVSPIVSTNNFLEQTVRSVNGGVLSIPITPATAVVDGTYQLLWNSRVVDSEVYGAEIQAIIPPTSLSVVDVTFRCENEVSGFRLRFGGSVACFINKTANSVPLTETDILPPVFSNTVASVVDFTFADGGFTFTYNALATPGATSDSLHIKWGAQLDLGGGVAEQRTMKFVGASLSCTPLRVRRGPGFTVTCTLQRAATSSALLKSDFIAYNFNASYIVADRTSEQLLAGGATGIRFAADIVGAGDDGVLTALYNPAIGGGSAPGQPNIVAVATTPTDPFKCSRVRVAKNSSVSCVMLRDDTGSPLLRGSDFVDMSGKAPTGVVSNSTGIFFEFVATAVNGPDFQYLISWAPSVGGGVAGATELRVVSASAVCSGSRRSPPAAVQCIISAEPNGAALEVSDIGAPAVNTSQLEGLPPVLSDGKIFQSIRAVSAASNAPIGVSYSSEIGGGVLYRTSTTIIEAAIQCEPRSRPDRVVQCSISPYGPSPNVLRNDIFVAILKIGRLQFLSRNFTTPSANTLAISMYIPPAPLDSSAASIEVNYNGDSVGLFAPIRSISNDVAIVIALPDPTSAPLISSDIVVSAPSVGSVTDILVVDESSGAVEIKLYADKITAAGTITVGYSAAIGGGVLDKTNITVIDATGSCGNGVQRLIIGGTVLCSVVTAAGSPAIDSTDLYVPAPNSFIEPQPLSFVSGGANLTGFSQQTS
eukprot:tig00020553_g10755.t1